jgi:hypothetical protein
VRSVLDDKGKVVGPDGARGRPPVIGDPWSGVRYMWIGMVGAGGNQICRCQSWIWSMFG